MEEEKTIPEQLETCPSDTIADAEPLPETNPESVPAAESIPEAPEPASDFAQPENDFCGNTKEENEPEAAADADLKDSNLHPANEPDKDSDLQPEQFSDTDAPETPAEDLPLTERLDRLEKLVAAYETQRQQQEEDRKLRSHFDGLYRQGEELKTRRPDFDLGRELENPLFAKLTAPGTGLTVLQAWACAHAEELASPKAPASDNPSRAHKDNRPAESGLNAQGASLSRFDYRQLSREQRENIKAAVRNARATGEKLYPPGT